MADRLAETQGAKAPGRPLTDALVKEVRSKCPGRDYTSDCRSVDMCLPYQVVNIGRGLGALGRPVRVFGWGRL